MENLVTETQNGELKLEAMDDSELGKSTTEVNLKKNFINLNYF